MNHREIAIANHFDRLRSASAPGARITARPISQILISSSPNGGLIKSTQMRRKWPADRSHWVLEDVSEKSQYSMLDFIAHRSPTS